MKKNRFWLYTFWFFFGFYLLLYLARYNGYYEKIVAEKSALTESEIEKFEEDVKNGNVIVDGSYIEKEKNYSNSLTRFANNFAKVLDKGVSKSNDFLENIIKSLFMN